MGVWLCRPGRRAELVPVGKGEGLRTLYIYPAESSELSLWRSTASWSWSVRYAVVA